MSHKVVGASKGPQGKVSHWRRESVGELGRVLMVIRLNIRVSNQNREEVEVYLS